MATWVQPAVTSQSAKRNQSSVMVENVRRSFWSCFMRHATTVLP
jgi:hypothetical protein